MNRRSMLLSCSQHGLDTEPSIQSHHWATFTAKEAEETQQRLMAINFSGSSTTPSSSSLTASLVSPSAVTGASLSLPLSQQSSSIYSTVTLSRSRGKIPPPPPARETSKISDPNAITLGTLKSIGASTYEEIKTLRRDKRIYESLAELRQNRESQEEKKGYEFQRKGSVSDETKVEITRSPHICYRKARTVFESLEGKKAISQDDAAVNDSEELPPPPPDAYSDTETVKHSYNRMTNIRRDFLQTLNAKLANQRLSANPQLSKRRSMSLNCSENEWDSNSSPTATYWTTFGTRQTTGPQQATTSRLTVFNSQSSSASSPSSSSLSSSSSTISCHSGLRGVASASTLSVNDYASLITPPTSSTLSTASYSKSGSLYSSMTLSKSRSKLPPPPPVRETSTISSPNAITLGMLKSAGVRSYKEMQELKRNGIYESICRLDTADTQNQISNSNNETGRSEKLYSTPKANDTQRSEYLQAKTLFQKLEARKLSLQTSEDEPLPPPPPDAYSDTETHRHGYNKITNIRRDFLQTLNAKLANHRLSASPQLSKRRSMSLSYSENDWDSDSGIVTNCSSISFTSN